MKLCVTLHVSAHSLISISQAALYVAVRSIYRLWFHPLSRFPGPKLAAVSEVWYAYHWMSGRYPWKIETMHMMYGDVVRIAPNELSFATVQSFNGTYSLQVHIALVWVSC